MHGAVGNLQSESQRKRQEKPDDVTVSDAKADAWRIVEGLVDTRTWPTLLLDGASRILASNAAATALLDTKGDWFMGPADDLRNRAPATTAEMQTCVRTLIENPDPVYKRIAYFAEQEDGGQTLVTMTRIDDRTALQDKQRSSGAYAVLVTIHEGCRREIEQSTKLLYDVFALTPAEARVAFALLDGMSLQAFSANAGVRISTVRWHLRNALAKTNCGNQRDLVRLLMSLVDQ